ncbi:hypothetical protein D3C72_1449300 [compost metagenome]
MVERAVAGRGVLVVGALLARQLQEFGEVLRGERRVHQQHVGHGADQADGLEVFLGVEARVLVQRGVDGLAAADRHEQRVAVLRALGDQLRADVAARAGAVVDHHAGVVQHLAELLAHETADDVVGAARGLGHDERDGARGVGLGGGRVGGQQGDGDESESEQRAGAESHRGRATDF